MDILARIKVLPNGTGLELPKYETDGSAGMDLRAAFEMPTPYTLLPGSRVLVPCGFAIALPQGAEAQIRPRSGLALKFGITVLNAPGTIDSDYRGEVGALLVNLGDAPFEINRGDRVAQMVIAPVYRAGFRVVASLDETERGAGGFGSTGQ